MNKALIAYVATLVTFLLLDGIWLGLLMAPTYRELLGSLMLENRCRFRQRFLLPVCFWLRGVCGAAGRDMAMGGEAGRIVRLIAYGTYDLTNWATLRGWSVQVTLMDWAWGTFATAVACSVGFLLARRFGKSAR